MDATLRRARAAGFVPATVLDIGAALGTFTSMCHETFPEARYVLVDPLDEYRESLDALGLRLGNTTIIETAVGRSDGVATINVHRDLFGSSLYHESEGPLVDGLPRTVPVTRLDTLSAGCAVVPPVLLKVDVQGAELDVLAGATATLCQTELVILEVSLFRFFDGGPQILEVLNFLNKHGFALYDVAGLLYRPLDDALAQLDLAFVREDGLFRRQHRFATPQQRAAQDSRFEAELTARGLDARGRGRPR